jgi:hypothetical protein
MEASIQRFDLRLSEVARRPLKVAHALMRGAIVAAKKKNDRIDAHKTCDCLRCDFLPECYMASTAIRERRRTLRYRTCWRGTWYRWRTKSPYRWWNSERATTSKSFTKLVISANGGQSGERRRAALAVAPVPRYDGATREDRQRAGAIAPRRFCAVGTCSAGPLIRDWAGSHASGSDRGARLG